MLGGIVAGAVAIAVATSLQRDEAHESAPDAKQSERPPAVMFAPTIKDVERPLLARVEEHRDEASVAHVEHKYRYLLADAAGSRADELKRRLLEYEIEEDGARKATADGRVIEMLLPEERDYYRALKDSDVEQHHVTEYVGGIGNIAPLDASQERQVLDAKLRQKQRYAATLRDAGLDRDALSEAERQFAHTQVAAALKGYLDDFLVEVSASLTSEQFTLLKNYETTEYQHELEKLQRQINSK